MEIYLQFEKEDKEQQHKKQRQNNTTKQQQVKVAPYSFMTAGARWWFQL